MNETEAIELLKKHSSDETSYKRVLSHALAVKRLAVFIADDILEHHKDKGDIQIAVDFIKSACILHDIGRFKCPPGPDSVKHGVAGAEILRAEGVDERYAHVCERHLGAGISKDEVEKKKLPLPPRDYLPVSIEEKIIAYADTLVAGDKIVKIEHAEERFENEIDPEAGRRVRALHEEIDGLMKSSADDLHKLDAKKDKDTDESSDDEGEKDSNA
ncbi:MAG: HD domain-containing protein [Candidatus Woesearchaeota archaeon]